MKIQELEYKGLNLLDVVGTVEIAIDAINKTIHIFDVEHIVAPEFHFQSKSYVLSEGFFKMANVLKQKQFFLENSEEKLEQWIELHEWIFYSSKQSIKMYRNGLIEVHKLTGPNTCEQSEVHIKRNYPKYFLRLKENK